MSSKLDFLFFVAQKREATLLLKGLRAKHPWYYEGIMDGKTLGVWITGVGKRSVRRSLKSFESAGICAEHYLNIGFAGALKDYRRGTIFPVGSLVGENGKAQIILDDENPFELVSVNSLQFKEVLRSQYPNADLVDMEAYTLAKYLPNHRFEVYKMVLDSFSCSPGNLGFQLCLPWIIFRLRRRWFRWLKKHLQKPSTKPF
ncbi:MAG: hypothetical protein AABZ14_03525 [Candidatus Margulisiibacteriota bacterium]